jgi:hypothetical protein
MKTSALIYSALIAGGIVGLLSVTPLVGCLVCLWLILGGLISVPIYQAFDRSTTRLQPSQGILLGVISGLVAAVIASIIGAFINAATYTQMINYLQSQEYFRDFFGQVPLISSGGFTFLGLICNLIVYPIFGLLGGLLGAALFKKQ